MAEKCSIIFENLIKLTGSRGVLNYYIFFACGLGALIGPLHSVSYQFLAMTHEYWCLIPVLKAANWTSHQIINISTPFEDKDSRCSINNYNYELIAEHGFDQSVANQDLRNYISGTPLISCPNNDFEFTSTYSSIISEWDIVCRREYLYSLTVILMQVGAFVSSIFCGYFGDIIGRRRVSLSCSVFYLLVNILTPISTTIEYFIMFKVLSTFLSVGIYMINLVIALEYCSPSQRLLIGIFYHLGWTIGYMLVPIIAYFVEYWRFLQEYVTFPSLILMINYWILPESARFLIRKGLYERAHTLLEAISFSNNREFLTKDASYWYFDQLNEVNNKKISEKQSHNICCTRTSLANLNSRKFTYILFYIWFSVSFAYFGTPLHPADFEISKYLSVLVAGLLEFLSVLIIYPIMKKLGRKKALVGCLLIGGLSKLVGMVISLVLTNNAGYIIFFNCLVKSCTTASFVAIFLITSEVHPTYQRCLMLGLASSWGRLGNIASLATYFLTTESSRIIFLIISGILLLSSGLAALTFPETSDTVLPDVSFELQYLNSNQEIEEMFQEIRRNHHQEEKNRV